MLLSVLALALGPVVANAALNQLTQLVVDIANIINMIIPIMIALAIIFFIWAVIKYVISSDEESKSKARSQIIYGLIGIFVIVAMWGIVNFLKSNLGIEDTSSTVFELPRTQ